MVGPSAPPGILVVGARSQPMRDALDHLRSAGWSVLGTTDVWEAILLLSQRPFLLLVQEEGLDGPALVDLSYILESDPSLRELPRLTYSPESVERLVTDVALQLRPPFPPEEAPALGTRFVRRRRPIPAPAFH